MTQITCVGDDFHLQYALISMEPGNEKIEIPMPRGAQAVPLMTPTGIKMM
jgi:hypothetical protein